MNDIKILEEFIILCISTGMNKEIAKAIENLIQRNKELEIQISARETVVDELTKENKELKEKINRQQEQLNIANKKILAQKGQLKVANNSYIPKSKIKEKIEEIKKYEDYKPLDNRFTYKELINYGIEILQELLEESEK